VQTGRRLVLLTAVALLAAWAPLEPDSAGAASGSSLTARAVELGFECHPQTSSDGVHFVMCTGQIPSFDGIRLDTDVSLPPAATTPRQTIVMLHGWSQDKTTWEANSKDGDSHDRWHWNNVWFVSHGWVVVNYTARGFKQSCGTSDPDPNCDRGYTHLADRRFEGRDSKFLLGRLVDAGIADRSRLVATGGSYGGGQSWLLATSMPWTSPGGLSLQLRAAVPKYPWTDLLSSLVYNGRATDRAARQRSHTRPIGVPKQSYIDALYAAGRSVGQGRYDENPAHPGTNFDLQYAFVQGGEPYDSKPNAQEIVHSYRFRSAYYSRAYFRAVREHEVREVPVLSIQGWTDPLFPPVETLQMFRKLEALDPAYPINMSFGDVGHSNAANPAAQWHPMNRLANRFLNDVVLGMSDQRLQNQTVAFRTNCPEGIVDQRALKGAWDSLGPGVARGVGAGSKATSSADPNPTDGPASDPLTRSGCISEDPSVTDPGGAYWRFTVPGRGITMFGLPIVRAKYAMTGQDATVGFKLWDEALDGSKTLVTRGAYRLSTATGDPAAGTLRTSLFGNFYRFAPGHEITIQITQNDSPYLRPDSLPSSITWSHFTLSMPTRQPGVHTLNPA
jgi:predicted acyl esterase